jgi:DNA transformation protein
MAASPDYTAYVLEQLAPIGRVRAAPLFGGTSLSRESLAFAFIASDNTLYFVVDDETRARYEAAGMAPFAYDRKNKRVEIRRFFQLPEEVLDDPDELARWAEEAIGVAARTPRKKSRRKTGKKTRKRRS